MKVHTATAERGERRASPQMPWPLVQPLPSRDPNPTRSPAAMVTGTPAESPASNRLGKSANPARPANASPTTKAACQPRGGLGFQSPETMPLMPAVRPMVPMSRSAAPPSNRPPNSA